MKHGISVAPMMEMMDRAREIPVIVVVGFADDDLGRSLALLTEAVGRGLAAAGYPRCSRNQPT